MFSGVASNFYPYDLPKGPRVRLVVRLQGATSSFHNLLLLCQKQMKNMLVEFPFLGDFYFPKDLKSHCQR